jgi:hypothetical protein
MNEKLKELERKSKLDSNYFNEKILEIIPFVIETEGRVSFYPGFFSTMYSLLI